METIQNLINSFIQWLKSPFSGGAGTAGGNKAFVAQGGSNHIEGPKTTVGFPKWLTLFVSIIGILFLLSRVLKIRLAGRILGRFSRLFSRRRRFRRRRFRRRRFRRRRFRRPRFRRFRFRRFRRRY